VGWRGNFHFALSFKSVHLDTIPELHLRQSLVPNFRVPKDYRLKADKFKWRLKAA
jgi:hypothetical protein